MKYDDFREIYRKEMVRMITAENGFMDYKTAAARIRTWQSRIANYVKNDTGDGMEVADRPASWGNHPEYRLLDDGMSVNFFKVKAQTIRALK